MNPPDKAARSVSSPLGDRSSPSRKTNRCVPSSAAGLNNPGTTTRAGTVRFTSESGRQVSGKLMLCTMKVRGAVHLINSGASRAAWVADVFTTSKRFGCGTPPFSFNRSYNCAERSCENATAGKPCSAPSQAPALVPLAITKPSDAFIPTLIPLITPSIGSEAASEELFFSVGASNRRCPSAMLTQSLGVPSTTHVRQPNPWSAVDACTGRLRDLAAPIQLCSCFGATTSRRCPALKRAWMSSRRKTLFIPSSFVTRKRTCRWAQEREQGARGECRPSEIP